MIMSAGVQVKTPQLGIRKQMGSTHSQPMEACVISGPSCGQELKSFWPFTEG